MANEIVGVINTKTNEKLILPRTIEVPDDADGFTCMFEIVRAWIEDVAEFNNSKKDIKTVTTSSMELIDKMQIIGDINYKLDTIMNTIDNFNSNLISQIPDRQKEIHKLAQDAKDLVSKVSKELFNKQMKE